MEAKEIQIGDWVRLQYNHYITQELVTEYFQVTGIYNDFETYYIWSESGNMSSVEHIQPIPLTAEILEKNGWKDWVEHSTIARSVSVLVEDNTSLCIQEIKGQDSMFVQISHCGAGTFEFRKHLKYVHELQHALRLCGIDKEIVL